MYRIVCHTIDHTEYFGDQAEAVIYASMCDMNKCDFDFERQDAEGIWEDISELIEEVKDK